MRRLLVTSFCAVFLALFLAGESRAAMRPNFVVFQTDDQSSRMLWESFRDKRNRRQVAMPFLRSIMNRGTLFQNHYVSSPICAPSRASLLSGQQPHNHGVLYNDPAESDLPGGWPAWRASQPFEDNFVTRLDAAGYHTAYFGKFFNYYDAYDDSDIPPGWDTWVADSDDESTRSYYGYTQLQRFAGLPAALRGPLGSPFYTLRQDIDRPQCSLVVGRGCNYHTDSISRLALREMTQAPGPFYMQLNFHAPHGDAAWPTGAQPATRHIDIAGRARLPEGGNFNESSVLDKPKQLQRGPLQWWERNKIKSFWRRGLESLRSVDEALQAVYQNLERRGMLRNTYIIFLSDNGIFLGDHRFALGKGLPYEEASRVPAWAFGPIFPGIRSGAPVSGVDWAPTITDLAGLPKEGLGFDGMSIPALLGSASPWRPQLISSPTVEDVLGAEFPAGEALKQNSGSGARFRALKVGPYKFVRHWMGGAELYDLQQDPEEEYNQVANPGYRELALWMNARLEDLRDCQGEECNWPAAPPLPSGWSEDVDSGAYPAVLLRSP